jgi:hypothetical protein
MYGGSQMNNYFTSAYVTTAYTNAVTLRVTLAATTTINQAAILYNNFHSQIILDYAVAANFLDVKYQAPMITAVSGIHS